MSRILVDKDVPAWKLFQKSISLGLVTPTEIQTVGRRQHRWISSEIAPRCFVSPGFEQDDILSISDLSDRPLEVSSPIHCIALFDCEYHAAHNQTNDGEVPQVPISGWRIVTDPSVEFHDGQHQEWEVGQEVARAWATDRCRIEKVDRDVH